MTDRRTAFWTRIRLCSQLAIALPLACYGIAYAQNPQLETKNGHAFATVVFTRALGTATPRFYSIAVDSTGSATYQSAPASLQRTGNPYEIEFAASAPVRDEIFRIAGRLDFFNVSGKSLRQPTANQAVNTLGFHEGNTDNQIIYYDSSDALVRQLTFLFESISETLEFSRRLTELHAARSAELGPELQSMLDLARRNRLSELFLLAPILSAIASDPQESDSIRERAKQILARAKTSE